MSALLEIVVAVLSGVTLFLGLIGLGVRFALLPYLKEHVIDPVKQTNKQVTVNHHSSKEPTVLDRIDDVHRELSALARMFDGHLDWSQREVDQLWRELKRKKNRDDD